MGINYSPKIVTDGLVLYLDAANPKSYPGTGTAWYDLSGSGNNGTLVNGPTYNSNNKGSISFDGVDDYVNIPNDLTLEFNINFTICFWLLDYGLTTLWKGIVGKHSVYGNPGGQGQGIAVYQNNGNLDLNLWWTTGNGSAAVQQMISNARNSTWNLITIGRSGSDIFWGKNTSILSSTWNSGSLSNTQPLLLGSAWQYSACNISNFQVYNRALSTNEIQQNFNATRGRYGI